jgi:hypothetical protein
MLLEIPAGIGLERSSPSTSTVLVVELEDNVALLDVSNDADAEFTNVVAAIMLITTNILDLFNFIRAFIFIIIFRLINFFGWSDIL